MNESRRIPVVDVVVGYALWLVRITVSMHGIVVRAPLASEDGTVSRAAAGRCTAHWLALPLAVETMRVRMTMFL